jgi:transposase InsO family protein
MLALIFRLLVILALQQQQLMIYKRQHPRPRLRMRDRLFWVAVSKLFADFWQQVLAIVQPDRVIRWHRELTRLRWRWISQGIPRKKIPQTTVGLVRHMAIENKTWGAERIRGELLKLGIRLSKRSIQKIIRPIRRRPVPAGRQSWKTFLANHADQTWAADFLTATTLGFKQIYVFVIVALYTREVVHWNVTAHPTADWTYRQVLQASWDGGAVPRFFVCDRDSKYGGCSNTELERRLGVKVLRTPFRRPKANAICERLIGSLRRECLDHFIILSEDHLRAVLNKYIPYYNDCRPHQGIGQRVPALSLQKPATQRGEVQSRPVLNGLHHHYYRKAA